MAKGLTRKNWRMFLIQFIYENGMKLNWWRRFKKEQREFLNLLKAEEI